MLIILFLLPIPLGANRPWAWGFFEICIFLLTIFVVVKHKSAKNLGIESYFTVLYLWIAFVLIATLQIIPLPSWLVSFLSPEAFKHYSSVNATNFFISIDRSQSLINFTKLLSLICLFICVLALVNSEKRLKLLLIAITGVATWQALYGILQIVFGLNKSIVFSITVGETATGSFVYNNHFATFLTLGLCAAFGLLVAKLEKNKAKENSVKHNSLFIRTFSSVFMICACIAIMVSALVMSHSRSGNIAFYASLGIVGMLTLVFMNKPSKNLKHMIIGIFVLNVIVIGAFYGLDKVREQVVPANQDSFAIKEVTRDAYPIISDFPIFGSGGGSFYTTFPKYQVQETSNFYDHLHNDYLQFVIEYGLLGAFILWTLMVFIIYKTIRAMNKRKHSIFKGGAFSCLMAISAMAVHMALDFPLQSYANACYFVVFIAIAMVINSLHLKHTKNAT